MKRLFPFVLLFLWTCSDSSSKSPIGLLGGAFSNSSSNFEITSPSEGEVLSIYQFDLDIAKASSGTYEVFLNEIKETEVLPPQQPSQQLLQKSRVLVASNILQTEEIISLH